MPVALVGDGADEALAGMFSDTCVTTMDMEGSEFGGEVVVELEPPFDSGAAVELALPPEAVVELALDSVPELVLGALLELALVPVELAFGLESDSELDPDMTLALTWLLAPEDAALEAALLGPVLLVLGCDEPDCDGLEPAADDEPGLEGEEVAEADGRASPLTDPNITAACPEADVATLVARLEAEPQPNCVKPPSKEFL